MYCRNCGSKISDKAAACTNCGSRPLNGTAYCNNCGKETTESAVVCTNCGISLSSKVSPVIGGILNWVWSGVGNIYLGQKTKGITLCAITLLLIIIDLVTCGFGAIIHVPYMIIMILDGVFIANRINNGEPVNEWQFF